MSASHQTEVDDIEIYAKGLSMESIQQWLENTFEHLATLNSGKVVHDLEVTYQGNTIPVMIVANAVGKAWTSIWFKSSGTPWEDDTQCARSLNQFTQCRVRCNSGPWQEGADMDEWWQLDESGQDSLIKWPNAS
ncbi:hypothetical protein [uncultured Endozoicomonas sp.]|uniref:hypothetical protein n=1 Tax=uncultured Endozoicomonas sp. TaxID=432652 RepID=UPI00260D1568|nr:hypothetical protein [uncultured Endozoicomonas sp.]